MMKVWLLFQTLANCTYVQLTCTEVELLELMILERNLPILCKSTVLLLGSSVSSLVFHIVLNVSVTDQS